MMVVLFEEVGMKSRTLLVTLLVVLAGSLVSCGELYSQARRTVFREMSGKLQDYRKSRDELKRLFPAARGVYNQRFYVFGMGPRPKMYYENKALRHADSGEVIRKWEVDRDIIVPSEHAVVIRDVNGYETMIKEDAEGIWMEDVNSGTKQPLSSMPINLPAFEDHKFGPVLRVLQQEFLVNIVNGVPLPNLFAYKEPSYRDAAMVCMALEKTGNLPLVSDWILRLREPFDKLSGVEEPDNLGQLLYMISLVSDSSHRAVRQVRDAAARYTVGSHIEGSTDGGPKPVYQTKWMKFGLKSLGMHDPYEIPQAEDPYAELVWWDFLPEGGVQGASAPDQNFPYLGWARAHYFRDRAGALFNSEDTPLSWESGSDKAAYAGMAVVDGRYENRKSCSPHAWHAAEMFLYILDLLK